MHFVCRLLMNTQTSLETTSAIVHMHVLLECIESVQFSSIHKSRVNDAIETGTWISIMNVTLNIIQSAYR